MRNTARKEIDDFALDVRARERREAAAKAKSPRALFFSRLYPGQRFPMKGKRHYDLVISRVDGDEWWCARIDLRDGNVSPEFSLSEDDFFKAIANSPTL